MKNLWLLLFALGFAGTIHAFEITEQTHIVIDKNAPESTRLAAEELACYVKKLCGKSLPVRKGRSNAVSRIFIGTLAHTPRLPDEAAARLAKADSPDAFAIVCKNNTLYIVGKDRVGELYGVYAFLDEKLGIRWFRTATKFDNYEYIPAKPTLKFADFSIIREPAFRYRQLSHVSATGKTPVNGQTLAVRQGFQISPPWSFKRAYTEKFYQARTSLLNIGEGGHTTFSKAVPKKLFDRHPEYFALVNGKRIKGNQICIADPAVQKLFLQYVDDLYKKYPANEVRLLFGMPDTTTGWCECKLCCKLDGSGAFDYINITNRFHKVAVKLMAEIYKKHPNAQLESWAYHTYRKVPDNVKYDSRAMIYYCTHGRCYGHKLNDPACERNVKQLANMKAWSKAAARMRLYDYANCTPIMYGCPEYIQVSDLKFFRQMGWMGWKEEMLFADADFWPRRKKGEPDHRADRTNSNWQWYCVMGKMLWNPDLDPAKILADVESKYYGKAYEAMKKYHDFRRELWNNSPHCLGYPTGDQRRPRLLSVPGAREKLLALLDEAQRLAGNDKILQGRLNDDRTWLQRYWIEPNEKIRLTPEKTPVIPLKTGNLKIDGDPDDGQWLGAWHTVDFGNKKGKTAETVFSLLAEKNHLYIRLIGSTAGKCRAEFYILPPGKLQKPYHLTVDEAGKVISQSPETAGTLAQAKSFAGKLVWEIKLPLKKLAQARMGSLWKIHAALLPANSGELNLSGINKHDIAAYRGFNIANNIIKNGTFEELDKNGNFTAWINSNCSIAVNGKNHALKIAHRGFAYQLLAGGVLAQKPQTRNIQVTFQASGKGTLLVAAHRYTDTKDGKAKHGYRRKNHPTNIFYQVKLTGKPRFYTCCCTIKANEWMALRFAIKGGKESFAIVDDAAITLLH